MNTPEIINEINEIIGRINENVSATTKRRGNAEDFLNDIKVDLETLKKNTEEKHKEHKEMVDEKVAAAKKVIESNFAKGPGWTETQNDLGEVKKILDELKGKIEEFGLEEERNNKDQQEELAEWRNLFPGQTARSVFTQLQKAQTQSSSNSSVSGINDGVIDTFTNRISGLQIQIKDKDTKVENLKEELRTKNKEIFELKNRDNSDGDINEQADKIREYGVIAVKTGVEEGSKVFPVVGPAVGGLIGAGVGGIGATTHAALYAGRQLKEIHDRHLDIVEDGMQKIYDSKDDIKEVALEVTKAGAGFEISGMNLGQATTKIGLNAEKLSVGIGMGDKKTFEEKLKAKDREIEILKQQIESQKQQIESQKQQGAESNQNLIKMAQIFAPNK